MSRENTIRKLLTMNDNEIESVMRRAWKKYTELINNIAHDIYKSCIQEFYSKYKPIKYKRHGYPEGKNLYQADDIQITESTLRIKTAAEQLWKYGGRDDKRDKVLTAVMNGKRGTKTRTKTNLDWPQPWETTYPNKFSDFFQWEAADDLTTMNEIMTYFVDNVLEDTKYIYWEFLDEII